MQIARVDIATSMMMRSLLAASPKDASEVQGKEAAAQQQPMPQVGQQAQQTAAGPMQNVAMLVTLAAADPGSERRRKAAADADRGLKTLDTLHKELLRGTATADRLRELAQWTASSEVPSDPQLAALYREIDVRVRVELAKYDIEA
jgi:hypothetical protein